MRFEMHDNYALRCTTRLRGRAGEWGCERPLVPGLGGSFEYYASQIGICFGSVGNSITIDPNSQGVQQLKSAAFPMIMSFDEEQKNHVRHLARNIGLESVASSFDICQEAA